MSPRAFQTILVASMGSKDRLELESKVLAAALKQSHARGDTSGVSLAHKQIFLLLRQQQAQDKPSSEAAAESPASMSDSGDQTGNRVEESTPTMVTDEPAVVTTTEARGKKRKRVMPDIVWTEDEGSSGATESTEEAPAAPSAPESEVLDRPAEAAETPEATESEIDFGESGEIPQMSPEPLADGEKPTFNAYGILAVEQIASFEEIHRHFLFHVRRVLMGLKKAKRKQRRPLLDELQNLWIAHDILSDPVTRTDFDFRILGLRGAPDVIIHSAPEDKTDISSRTPLRIGELMQCAGLLEPTELEIAADMHKAMPEMLFGAFLVKQGFISEEDLGQVLMGQRLLKNGNLTVGHYQMCMKRWRENQIPIEETAVAEGLVTQQEMERVVASGLRDTSGVPAYQGGSQGFRASAPVINAEEAAKRNLSVGHAVPQWKDQLDWSEPEAIQEYVAEDRDSELRKPIENNLDIEGITDGVSKDSSKKSLRRLMEGIHSPDSGAAGDSENSGVQKSLKSILSMTNEPQGQVKVDRLAAPPQSQENEVAAEVPSAPEVQDKQSEPTAEDVVDQAHEQSVHISQETVQEPSQEEQGNPLFDGSISQETTMEWASAQSVTQDRIQQVSANDALQESSPTVELAFESNLKFEQGPPQPPPVVADETTTEELAIKPDEPAPSTARPTLDVPVSKIVIEERSTKRLTLGDEDDDDVFGTVNYDDEDDVELGFDVEIAPAAAAEVTPSEPSAPQAIPSSDDAPVDMDDLLDFSTPPPDSDGSERSDIRKVLDEAFHGVRVPELPPQAPAAAVISESSDFVEAHFDAIPDEESHMESGVFSANLDAAADPFNMPSALPVVSEVNLDPAFATHLETNRDLESNTQLDVNLGEHSESPSSSPTTELEVNLETVHQSNPPDRRATEFTLSSSILASVEPKAIEESPESDQQSEAAAEAVSEVKAPEEEADEAAERTEESIDESIEEPTGEIEAVKKSDSITLTDVSMPAAARQKPDAQTDTKKADDEEQSAQDQTAQDPSAGDDKEDPQDRLKSGEWQIVYKLEGSLADMFLSNESEPEMPKLRPRLTEIDSIIPSSLTKITKGDADKESESEGKEDAKGDATKSGDKSSDKPVIKPVSNNYYREKGGKADKGKDSDKKNKAD